MIFGLGVNPIFTILIFFLALIVLSDFLVEQFSARLTLSLGKFQSWLFYGYGQNLSKDSVISAAFHFLSFRKQAYFLQIFSFFNVGSFARNQIFYILLGSFIGLGSSVLLLLNLHIYVSLSILFFGFILRFQSKEQIRDFGMAAIYISLFLFALNIFNMGLIQSTAEIRQFDISIETLFISVFLSSLVFRTPAPFFLIVSLYHLLVGMNLWLMMGVFFVHGIAIFSPLYLSILNKNRRLYFSLGSVFLFQLLQLAFGIIILMIFPELHENWFEGQHFVGAFNVIILSYFSYFSFSLLLLSPILFLFKSFSLLKEKDIRRKPSQKIIAPQKNGKIFSIHFSLFMLRHEFIKMATLVHTVLKLGREADVKEEDINERLSRYQGILSRVGDEIKNYCFSVGKQRSYRWHIQEIMSYYKTVNQLELMVEDLALVIHRLQEKDLNKAWEKECRLWLNFQLKIYEVFFGLATGVPLEEPDKVTEYVSKSYEILGRIQKIEELDFEYKELYKIFYRVTENNGSLSIKQRK